VNEVDSKDIDLWMQETLNSWAQQGSLSSDKSIQLQANIAKLAQGEKKSLSRRIYSLAAAIITFIWLLFVSCPAAAAAYAGTSFYSSHKSPVKFLIVLGVFSLLFCRKCKFETMHNHFEVYYE
jgi:hypothetical protein